MRIALGSYTHEADCFSAHNTDMDDFRARTLAYGDEMLEDWRLYRSQVSGAMSVLSAEPDNEVVPLLAAGAMPAAPILEDVYRTILDDLLGRLRAAMPVDGVLLVLHGAMMAVETPDGTGEVLAMVREVVGPDVPIVGTLDLHANVTEQMVRTTQGLVGFHTSPHRDQFETGESAAQLLTATLKGEAKPTTALVRLPWISSSEHCTDMWGPLSEVLDMVKALEAEGTIIHGGIYPVQAWLDTPDVASAVVVITDNDSGAAAQHAGVLAHAFWDRREQFLVDRVDPDEAVRQTLARESGTVVFCDSADSVTSGSSGDSTTILAALLRAAPVEPVALLNVIDAEVVAEAIEAGVGSTIDVQVGGKIGTRFFQPVQFRGYVAHISDGSFSRRISGGKGPTLRRGRTVLLTQRGIRLVVSERTVSQWDPAFYCSLGEEPCDARIIQVKSPMGFREAYDEIADEVILVDTPGASTPDLASLPWRHISRPIYPLDLDTKWP